MIIVEGPDGAGKTTLVEQLSRSLGWPVAEKAVSSAAVTIRPPKEWVETSLSLGWHPMIYDRHALISEGIYGPAWKGRLRVPFEDAGWLEQMNLKWAQAHPFLIICLPRFLKVMDNITFDQQNFELYNRPGRNVGQIYWPYHWRAAQPDVSWVWDYERGGYDALLDDIDESARYHGVRLDG